MQLSQARVLVVDDEPALCEIFTHWMTLAGCRDIRTAQDGRSALEAVAAAPIDVLVTDVRMPLMDGVTLVRSLVDRGEQIPIIIFVSGFGDVDQREMYGLGVEAFLSKPLRREELTSALTRAVAESNELWTHPLEIAPRQTLEISPAQHPIHIGHGGFSAGSPTPLTHGRIAFHTSPAATQPLTGHGYVRWYSRAEQRVGIEFAYLEESSRTRVLDDIEASKPLAFIPSK
jgi:two-component system, response regulator YesN